MLVGEIGISPDRFRYGLQWWEIRCIIRGYNRRHRDLWGAMRWQTYNLMCVSMADISKAGINCPADLIRFPWEHDDDTDFSPSNISPEEIERLQQMMREENRRNGF